MLVVVSLLTLGVVGAAGFVLFDDLRSTEGAELAPPSPTTTTLPPITTTTVAAPPPTTSTTLPARDPGTVPGYTVGEPWGSAQGLLMFRGNPTRTYYGGGPVPADPQLLWTYPEAPMCSRSSDGAGSRLWCGTGWTGQPAVWERPDGVTEVVVGTYDPAVHFIDAETGRSLRPPFFVGDLIKGSVTIDPDGYPLLYFGSRDNNYRVVALDRDVPTELWSVNSNVVNGIWNNDWDSNGVVIDDVLFVGGENGWFFAIELNRGFDEAGLVTVEPEIVVSLPGYNDELRALVGNNVGIENSVAVFDDRVYFSNSGGRVVGLDVSNVREGEAPIEFDYWVGDDVDASIVIDQDGMLYVSVELERFNERAEELGQLIKLDPTAPDPYVWGIPVPPTSPGAGGLWATPALGNGVLYAATHPGELLAVDTDTGEVTWRTDIGWHAWSSPALVDNTLVVTTCTGQIRAWDVSADPRQPNELWTYQTITGNCIESTPAIWDGRIYVGSRDGFIYALGD